MNAGDLDRRITIKRARLSRDQLNNPVETWDTLATVWASKRDVSDAERRASQETGAELSARFQIRRSSAVADVNPKDRVCYAGRVYDIVGVKEVEGFTGLELSCLARADLPATAVAGD